MRETGPFFFLFFFAHFGLYSIAHRYTTMIVLTMDGWEFFVTLVILLNAKIDWEAIASRRVIDYVKVEENPMFRPP